MMTISMIVPGLFVGSAPYNGDFAHLARMFDKIVLAAEEHQPRVRGMRTLIHVPMPDSVLSSPQRERVVEAGRYIARLLDKDEVVLSTCQLGLNRSALLAGIALMESHRHHMTAEQAIGRIRAMRGPDALCNRYFVQLLRDHRPARWSHAGTGHVSVRTG